MKKILMVANSDNAIWNTRKELIQCLLKKNYEVYLSTPYGERIRSLEEMGCHHIDVQISRHGTNVLMDLRLFIYYVKLIKEIQPDWVFSYTIKPNVYGGFASAICKVPFIMNITGLGIAVENQGILSKVALFLYRCAARKAQVVFFQNQSNLHKLCLKQEYKYRCRLLPGSGVNIEEFVYLEYPSKEQPIKLLFLGRIMRDKGIEELLSAATEIKKHYPTVEFIIAGECEKDYSGNLEEALKAHTVSYLGYQTNVQNLLREVSAVVLPSYHEGMSNVLLEASACGRPVLASRIPGCQEIFDEGITGMGFDPRSVESLEQAIEKFILLPYETRKQMGIVARKKVGQQFDRKIVIDAYLEEMNKIYTEESKI